MDSASTHSPPAVRGRKSPPAESVHLEPGARVPAASAPAQDGPEQVTEPVDYDAILLMGFGGPQGQEDVIPFLRNVTAGRGIPDERLEEVATHYRHYDGISPINAQTQNLREALAAALPAAGIDLPVYWGNRNWGPYLVDALIAAHAEGHRKILAIATSAYSSYSSCRQYREDIADALQDSGLAEELQVDKVRQYFDHPGFVAPFFDGVTSGLRELTDGGARTIEVLFATHSIPTPDAQRSGPEELNLGEGGAYAAQHLAVADLVMQRATADLQSSVGQQSSADAQPTSGGQPSISWQLVYQSRSGPLTQPWLEPDVNDAIAELPKRGVDAVLIVPLGFLSDHMEVLWDLDNEAMETAGEHGLKALRAPTPGTDPQFVDGLVDLVSERLQGRPKAQRQALTDLGPWFDVCRPGCCENVRRGFRPAAAGVAP